LVVKGLNVEVVPSNFDENLHKSSFDSPSGYVKETALQKALHVARTLRSETVCIACWTVLHLCLRFTGIHVDIFSVVIWINCLIVVSAVELNMCDSVCRCSLLWLSVQTLSLLWMVKFSKSLRILKMPFVFCHC